MPKSCTGDGVGVGLCASDAEGHAVLHSVGWDDCEGLSVLLTVGVESCVGVTESVKESDAVGESAGVGDTEALATPWGEGVGEDEAGSVGWGEAVRLSGGDPESVEEREEVGHGVGLGVNTTLAVAGAVGVSVSWDVVLTVGVRVGESEGVALPVALVRELGVVLGEADAKAEGVPMAEVVTGALPVGMGTEGEAEEEGERVALRVTAVVCVGEGEEEGRTERVVVALRVEAGEGLAVGEGVTEATCVGLAVAVPMGGAMEGVPVTQMLPEGKGVEETLSVPRAEPEPPPCIVGEGDGDSVPGAMEGLAEALWVSVGDPTVEAEGEGVCKVLRLPPKAGPALPEELALPTPGVAESV